MLGQIGDLDPRHQVLGDLPPVIHRHQRERRFAADQHVVLVQQRLVDDVDDFGDGLLGCVTDRLGRDVLEGAVRRRADDGQAGLLGEPFQHGIPAFRPLLELDALLGLGRLYRGGRHRCRRRLFQHERFLSVRVAGAGAERQGNSQPPFPATNLLHCDHVIGSHRYPRMSITPRTRVDLRQFRGAMSYPQVVPPVSSHYRQKPPRCSREIRPRAEIPEVASTTPAVAICRNCYFSAIVFLPPLSRLCGRGAGGEGIGRDESATKSFSA